MYIDYEFISFDSLQEDEYYEPFEVEDDYDEEFEALDELSVTLAVADLLEELSDSLA